MSSESNYWQLQAFAGEVGSHYTTVNDWFNLLETRRVHYVSRAADGKRVFDILDLQVGKYIKQKRNEKWSLDAILSNMQNEIETRPFPTDFEHNGDYQLASPEAIKALLMSEMNELFENKLAELREQMQQSLVSELNKAALFAAETEEKTRANRVTDMITENRLKTTLEIEALDEWAKLPLEERTQKVGWFKREDDVIKRERFIRQYVQKHYADRLREEFETPK